jgi:D-arabinose 1-dehydrogenase-like Zn-dependent alcohol dehydrogenase
MAKSQHSTSLGPLNMIPETMKAIKIVSARNAEIQTVPVPELRENYILVKVQAVAINPTDWCVI